jgi:hypothetical protein
MTSNLSIFYTAYPYRQLSPQEQLRTIRAEIMTPLGNIRGLASVIEAALQRTAIQILRYLSFSAIWLKPATVSLPQFLNSRSRMLCRSIKLTQS